MTMFSGSRKNEIALNCRNVLAPFGYVCDGKVINNLFCLTLLIFHRFICHFGIIFVYILEKFACA